MSAQAVMAALGTILPAGTPVAAGSVFIERGANAVTSTFPVLLIECPDEDRVRTAIRAKASTFLVSVLYLDRWEAAPGGRTIEQVKADARAAVTTMLANLDANPQLLVGGVANCNIAGDHVRVRLDGVLRHQDLGFPVVQCALQITVLDFWEAV